MRHQLFEILNMDKALREKQKTYATANESLTLENAQLAGENTDSNEQLDGLQHQRLGHQNHNVLRNPQTHQSSMIVRWISTRGNDDNQDYPYYSTLHIQTTIDRAFRRIRPHTLLPHPTHSSFVTRSAMRIAVCSAACSAIRHVLFSRHSTLLVLAAWPTICPTTHDH